MPTYIYRREDGTTFECFQRITADPLTECPTTHQKVRRVISGGTGFILKGSGFYKTDYASNGNGTTSSNEQTAEGEDINAEKPSETKVEAGNVEAETGKTAE